MLKNFFGFKQQNLTSDDINELKQLTALCRGDILKMTTLAKSGHPGGSMSSIDIYAIVYLFSNIKPDNPNWEDRDRIIISHGHTSPGVYSILGRLDFFPLNDAIALFRKAGSIYEGHIERCVPGITWATGNLGQGLAVACGMALTAKTLNKNFKTFCIMGDGEQQKGMIAEARHFAIKYKLNNLVAIIDKNDLQLSGSINEIMPVNVKEMYLADGWNVLEIDGHDFNQIYNSLYDFYHDKFFKPLCIIAKTTMGKGVSFMENLFEYHGAPLKSDKLKPALEELGLKVEETELTEYQNARNKFVASEITVKNILLPERKQGDLINYNESTECRTAMGNTFVSFAQANPSLPFIVLNCDLKPSVKTGKLQKEFPQNYIECGIAEHFTAIIGGAMSTQGIVTVWPEFGVFGVDEVYNQMRLNDINHSQFKLFCTHLGLEVGEDGKTHQCIDYIGLLRNLYNVKILMPADANQTDKITRYVLSNNDFCFVGMGRSKLPVIKDSDGNIFFGQDYKFVYGKADLLRDGEMGSIITYGGMVNYAIDAWNQLKQDGIDVKVINFSSIKDLDTDMLDVAAKTKNVIVYEDHNVNTGLGSILASYYLENKYNINFTCLGVKKYGLSGTPEEVYKDAGLLPEQLVNKIKQLII